MKRETLTTEAELLRSAATGALPRRELIRRGLRVGSAWRPWRRWR